MWDFFFLLLSLPCVRLLAFLHSWYHEILLALKEDKITDIYYLCHLLWVLRVIIKSCAICTSMHLYTIIIFSDGTSVCMCPCKILFIACMLYYGMYIWVDITKVWITSNLFFVFYDITTYTIILSSSWEWYLLLHVGHIFTKCLTTLIGSFSM